MAKLSDDIEKIVDESMLFIERLDNTNQLKKHGCLTVAQCATLLCMHNNTEKPDRSEDASTYIMLALHDIKCNKLQVIHPETLLPWTEYFGMIEAGVYSSDGLDAPIAPMVTVGWLVRLDECEKWYRSKGLAIDLSAVKSDLDVLKVETPSATKTSLDANTSTSPSWKANAKQIGKKIHKEKPNLNVEQIAQKTHTEMTKRKNEGEDGMTGRGGKIPSSETIKRHALTGIKS